LKDRATNEDICRKCQVEAGRAIAQKSRLCIGKKRIFEVSILGIVQRSRRLQNLDKNPRIRDRKVES